MPAQASTTLTSNLACFLSMFMWALAFPIAEVLLQTWNTVGLVAVRISLAALTLLLVWLSTDGISAVTGAPWRRGIWVGGLGFGIGSFLLLAGQKMSNPVTPAIAAAMMPVAGAMLEVALDGKKLNSRLVLGIVLALSGGIIASGANLADTSFGAGALLCLLAVFMFAWGSRATSRNFPELTTIGKATITVMGAWVLTTSVYVVFRLLDFDSAQIGVVDVRSISLLVASAVLGLGISQLLWIWGVGKLGILLASIHMNAVPFYVMAVTALFLMQPWNWQQAFGGVLVMTGVLVSQLGKKARLETKLAPAK